METTQEKKIEFAKHVTYEIGGKKAVVNCNFNQKSNKTVTGILSRLIQADIENA